MSHIAWCTKTVRRPALLEGLDEILQNADKNERLASSSSGSDVLVVTALFDRQAEARGSCFLVVVKPTGVSRTWHTKEDNLT